MYFCTLNGENNIIRDMDVKEIANDGLVIRLSFHFVKEDYADQKKKILNRFRHSADIRGFRKGMAPFAMIDKLYGGQALVEAVNALISDNLNKYIEDNKLSVIGEPLPVDDGRKNDYENSDEFDFTFDIALAPKFEMSLSAEDKIPYYEVRTDAPERKKYKEAIYARYATLEPCEEVAGDSYIVADFSCGERKKEGAYIAMAYISENGRKQLLGKKVSDSLDIDVVECFPNEADRAAMLGLKKEELSGIEPLWHVEIREIKHYVNAVPGKELYDKVFGPDKVATEEEFDKAVTERMEQEFKQESEYRFMLDAREYLINKGDIRLPEDFLKRWLFSVNEGKYTMEEIEKDFPMFLKDFRWQSIEGRIISDAKLEVTKEAVDEQARKLARYQFAMYGLPEVPEDRLSEFVAMILKDDKQSQRLYEKAQEEVVLDYVRRTVTLEKKKISSDKLRKMNA